MIPINFLTLHAEQLAIREKSLTYINDNNDLSDHLSLIEVCLDSIDQFRQVETDDEDLNTCILLGLRLFNATASAWNLMAFGYYQTAAALIRDIIETGFLLGDFQNDKKRISQWRTANDKNRKQDFKPFAVRTRLDNVDGYIEKKRASVYDNFCELAAHPHPRGFLLIEKDGLRRSGPFFEEKLLRAILEELVQRLASAVLPLGELMPISEVLRPVHRHLINEVASWSTKYLTPQNETVSRT